MYVISYANSVVTTFILCMFGSLKCTRHLANRCVDCVLGLVLELVYTDIQNSNAEVFL